MSSTSTVERTPLVISAGDLVVGPVHASFRDDDPTSLLHNYLVLIRQLRGQQREPQLTLRGEDISALAQHLDTSETAVLGDLLDLMGATRAQRKALFSLFAAGALIIVATGSVALNLSSDGAAAELAPVELVAAAAPEAPAMAQTTTVIETPTTEPEEFGLEPVMAIAYGGTEWASAVELSTSVAPATTTSDDEAVTSGTPGPGEGVADDGSTVAVAPPPVPPVEGVGIADDGSTVAVAPPPVPPVEGVGIADDGSTVAVAPPPVP